MEHANRVAQLWNWLPAFRVVAETQHLPTASKELHLSASALSRAVRLLEDELGQPLFQRAGRNLVLSPAGAQLLRAVRDAMRRVDDGVTEIGDATFTGPVRIAAPGPYASMFILPALNHLRREHPKLVPHVLSAPPDVSKRQLLDGTLDISVLDAPIEDDDLVVHHLGELSSSIYVGEGHPLVGREDATLADALEYPFVGPPTGLSDHWPAQIERKLGMVVAQMHVAVQACAAGELLALLPDAIADAYGSGPRLYRLPIDIVARRSVYAVSRTQMGEPGRVEAVIQTVRNIVQATRRRPLSSPPATPSSPGY